MFYASLLAVHVLSGVFWGGAAIFAGLFLMPSLMKAGPAAGPVMGNLIQLKPSPQQIAEISAAQIRLARAGKLGAWHVFAAATLMGLHSLFR
jgi:hypothetical protein